MEAGVGFRGHLAVFAAQVADFAGGGLGGFADGRVTALVRIEVAEGGGAVARGGNGVDVDAVDWRVGSQLHSASERGMVVVVMVGEKAW